MTTASTNGKSTTATPAQNTRRPAAKFFSRVSLIDFSKPYFFTDRLGRVDLDSQVILAVPVTVFWHFRPSFIWSSDLPCAAISPTRFIPSRKSVDPSRDSLRSSLVSRHSGNQGASRGKARNVTQSVQARAVRNNCPRSRSSGRLQGTLVIRPWKSTVPIARGR